MPVTIINPYQFTAGGGGGTAPTDHILQWKFNGNTDDTGSSGTLAGIVNGTETYTTGQTSVANTAVSLNGTNNYVYKSGVADFTSQPFTIAMWVYVNSGGLASEPVLIFKGEYSASGYFGGLAANGRVYFDTNQSGAVQETSTAAGAITAAAWYHIAVVRSGANVKLYVNGSDTGATTGTHINPTSAAGNAYAIGAYGINAVASNWLNGRIDDHRIYDYALTSGQVAAIYAANAE